VSPAQAFSPAHADAGCYFQPRPACDICRTAALGLGGGARAAPALPKRQPQQACSASPCCRLAGRPSTCASAAATDNPHAAGDIVGAVRARRLLEQPRCSGADHRLVGAAAKPLLAANSGQRGSSSQLARGSSCSRLAASILQPALRAARTHGRMERRRGRRG
jgi:hypothetical protein